MGFRKGAAPRKIRRPRHPVLVKAAPLQAAAAALKLGARLCWIGATLVLVSHRAKPDVGVPGGQKRCPALTRLQPPCLGHSSAWCRGGKTCLCGSVRSLLRNYGLLFALNCRPRRAKQLPPMVSFWLGSQSVCV